MKGHWVWVSLPHATFAVVIRDGRIVDAAPVARWAVGKPERQVADYFRRKGARFALLGDEAESPRAAGPGARCG